MRRVHVLQRVHPQFIAIHNVTVRVAAAQARGTRAARVLLQHSSVTAWTPNSHHVFHLVTSCNRHLLDSALGANGGTTESTTYSCREETDQRHGSGSLNVEHYFFGRLSTKHLEVRYFATFQFGKHREPKKQSHLPCARTSLFTVS